MYLQRLYLHVFVSILPRETFSLAAIAPSPACIPISIFPPDLGSQSQELIWLLTFQAGWFSLWF